MTKYQQGFPVNSNGEIVLSGTNQSVVGVLPIDWLPVDDSGGLKLSHPTMIVNTIADLKALSAGQFSSVQVLGYYAAGDGGGGVFRWNGSSSTADNGGTVIIPNSAPGTGRWERLYQVLDVMMFGAKGDGLTDDTAAIQAAQSFIDITGGTLIIPPAVYLVSGDCGNGGTGNTRIHVIAYGAELRRIPTSNSYTMFSFRQNMVIEGLKLKGHVQSGTGWADVVPATSFGFRSSTNSAGQVLFIDCEADGLPYDGWYVSNPSAQVKLINCVGQNCYRNDFAAVAGNSIEIEGGSWGYNAPGVNKVTAIDIEPDSETVNFASIKGIKSYHALSMWAANGAIRHGVIDGVVLQDSAAQLAIYRVKQMDIGEIKLNGSAAYGQVGIPTILSGQTFRPIGTLKRLANVREAGANLISYPYNSVSGFTQSAGGTNSSTLGHAIGNKQGVRVTNSGGGFNVYKQTVTVTADTHYTIGGLMQINAAPSGGDCGFFVEFPTLGNATVWLSPAADYSAGAPNFLSSAVKIPVGVTSVNVGFGSSSGTQDNTFTDVFFAKGIIGEGEIDVIKREAGLWTPTLSFTSPGSSSWAYTVQVGRLSRNGQRVTLSFAVTATLTKGTASGDLIISGLPYTVFNVGIDLYAGDVGFSANFATPPVATLARNNSTSAYVMKTTASPMTAADMVDATQYTIRGELSYEI